jgi:hypothetical protein
LEASAREGQESLTHEQRLNHVLFLLDYTGDDPDMLRRREIVTSVLQGGEK